MDIINLPSDTKIHTTHVVLSLGVDTMSTTANVFCPFEPDRIILRNVYFDNPSTNGDSILLMSATTLFEPFSKYSLALDSSVSFTNVNLTFANHRSINMTHNFGFTGITGSAVHDAAINIVLAIEFLKF